MSELEEVCAEYSRNFAALEQRYRALEQRLQTEKDLVAQHERAAQRQREEMEKQLEEQKGLRRELEEMTAYKESFYNAKIQIEHLKGRLEAARTGVADREREHQHEVEQLRAQTADLHKRLEVSADAAHVQQLRQQRTELEERCALVTGQLLELRESASHGQLASNAALRDVSARNNELEQRCRTMEQEMSQARAQTRRATEAQTEATLARDRYELERARQALEVEALRKELAEQRSLRADDAAASAAQLQQRQSEWDAEREQLEQRVAAANREAEAAVAQRLADDERLAGAHRAASAKLAALREDHAAELEEVQTARAAAVDEASKLRWRAKQLEQQLEEVRAGAQQAEVRTAGAEAQREQLRGELDAAVQEGAWAAAERDRLAAQLAAMSREAEEGAALRRALAQAQLELDRAKMQLKYADVDLAASRKETERAASQAANLEQLYHEKMQQLAHDMKAARKHHKTQLARGDEMRRKLAGALAKREAELHRLRHQMAGTANGSGENRDAVAAVWSGQKNKANSGSSGGALAMLKQQSDMAIHLQETLGRL